jgi:hypothetical protein
MKVHNTYSQDKMNDIFSLMCSKFKQYFYYDVNIYLMNKTC